MRTLLRRTIVLAAMIVNQVSAGGIGRRALLGHALLGHALIGGALLASSRPAIAASSESIEFRIMRHGGQVGHHAIRVTETADGYEVTVDIEARIGNGPITLYRYVHHNREVWRNGALDHMVAATDHDGRPQSVRVERTADGLLVDGTRGPRYLAPLDTHTSTWWNPDQLQPRLIDTQDGQLFATEVKRLGDDRVGLADGAAIPATRFSVLGTFTADMWYDQKQRWSAMRLLTKDGSIITYERL